MADVHWGERSLLTPRSMADIRWGERSLLTPRSMADVRWGQRSLLTPVPWLMPIVASVHCLPPYRGLHPFGQTFIAYPPPSPPVDFTQVRERPGCQLAHPNQPGREERRPEMSESRFGVTIRGGGERG